VKEKLQVIFPSDLFFGPKLRQKKQILCLRGGVQCKHGLFPSGMIP
jgi:hypothetical protein